MGSEDLMPSTEGRNACTIALIPGDGIGPEVMAEAEKVLDAVADRFRFSVRTTTLDWGCNRFERNGAMMPDDALEILARVDAVLLGAVGDASRVPDHVSLDMLLTILRGFELYVNLRPIRLLPMLWMSARALYCACMSLMIFTHSS